MPVAPFRQSLLLIDCNGRELPARPACCQSLSVITQQRCSKGGLDTGARVAKRRL